MIGLLIAGLITVLFKPHQFEGIMGGGIFPMLLMMLIGIPLYVCATASVPIALALITAGVSPGAALVFLMTGPATNAATIGTIWQVMGKRTAVIYLVSVTVTALASGLILDYIFTFPGYTVEPWMPNMIPHWIHSVSAVLLLAVLGYALVKPFSGGMATVEDGKTTLTRKLKITGMDCSHCVKAVSDALLNLPGIGSVKIDLKAKVATIGGTNFDSNSICSVIETAGFSIECYDHEGKSCMCD